MEEGDKDMQLKVLGRPIGPGTMMQIKGERGTFKFLYPTWSSEGRLSLTFVGGLAGHLCYRSFYPEKVKKVL
jgi:hypothetical protein